MTCGRVGAPDGPGPVLIGADLRGASEARARVPAAAAGRSVLARLPSMVARQLLAVLPASKQAADLAIASVESAALNRARAGEPDHLLAGSPTFGFDDPFSA